MFLFTLLSCNRFSNWMRLMIEALELFVAKSSILLQRVQYSVVASNWSFLTKLMQWQMMHRMLYEEVCLGSHTVGNMTTNFDCIHSYRKVHGKCAILHHLQLSQQNHTSCSVAVYTFSICSIGWGTDFAKTRSCYPRRKVCLARV